MIQDFQSLWQHEDCHSAKCLLLLFHVSHLIVVSIGVTACVKLRLLHSNVIMLPKGEAYSCRFVRLSVRPSGTLSGKKL